MSDKLTQNLTEATVVNTTADRVPIYSAASPDELRYMTPDNLVPDASATVEGKVELATTAETETGTDATRAVTPAGLHGMTTLSGASWFKDEDNMSSDSPITVPSQQSVKAYVDTKATTEKADLTKFSNLYAPQGFLINGKISVTVASNNITVALKTLAGTDPSATDPVYCRIGDTVRSITSALSVTKNAGTNWFNSGSSELATKEIDYFVYLGYNSTDGVVIGFSRIPFANRYGDFSTTTTNEKYSAISTITNAASTDYYEVIGRFAATLSDGAGYTWSVPTYTASNIIQRPIYETRLLTWVPVFTGFSSNPTGTYQYRVLMNRVLLTHSPGASGTSNATTFKFSTPFVCSLLAASAQVMNIQDGGSNASTPGHMEIVASGTTIDCYKTFYRGEWTGSSKKDVFWHEFLYEI